jgi:ComF family protein
MLRRILRPLIDLTYYVVPDQCALCGMMLHEGESCICLHCLFELPRTGFMKQPDNPAAMAFWGRIDFRHVAASFYYRRANSVQRLIHNLKYHGDREAGVLLGQLLGSELQQLDKHTMDKLLVPVPLARHKERVRGYNQSLLICEGISDVTGWPIDDKLLVRTSGRESQTKMNRVKRWENTKDLYQIRSGSHANGRHIWLIDDVITTGSTLEACGLALQPALDSGLSAAAVAFSAR